MVVPPTLAAVTLRGKRKGYDVHDLSTTRISAPSCLPASQRTLRISQRWIADLSRTGGPQIGALSTFDLREPWLEECLFFHVLRWKHGARVQRASKASSRCAVLVHGGRHRFFETPSFIMPEGLLHIRHKRCWRHDIHGPIGRRQWHRPASTFSLRIWHRMQLPQARCLAHYLATR